MFLKYLGEQPAGPYTKLNLRISRFARIICFLGTWMHYTCVFVCQKYNEPSDLFAKIVKSELLKLELGWMHREGQW